MDKKAKMLEKVRALLAKADSTKFPEEAEAFRTKADEMMTIYAIDQWQVDAAQNGHNARPEPEVRNFDFAWFSTSTRASELWSLFLNVSRHCRCVVAVRGYNAGATSYNEIPVIGLPSDLDYFDMLFTHLMLQMGKQLEPKPDPNLSLDENAYLLRSAGMARPRAAKLLWDAGLLGDTGGVEYADLSPSREKSQRARMRVACQRWEKEHGLDSTTRVSPGVYQRSFANGFVQEVATRLRNQKRMQEQKQTGGMELALRDITVIVNELYAQLWPASAATGGGSRALVREKKMDAASYQTGVKAGREAKIVSGANERVGGKKKELN